MTLKITMFKQLSANSCVQNQLYKFPMSRCLHIICICAHVFNRQYEITCAIFSTFAICRLHLYNALLAETNPINAPSLTTWIACTGRISQ